jgi:hypothetical protein
MFEPWDHEPLEAYLLDALLTATYAPLPPGWPAISEFHRI